MDGYVTLVKFKREQYVDIVPVDYVTNIILAATAFTAI
jgi:hypothetical protein